MKKKEFSEQAHLILRVLRAGWKARPVAIVTYFVAAVVEISSFLASMYASAKLAAELANFATSGSTGDIWVWFWIDVVAITITAVSSWLMNHMQRLLYFKVSAWSSDQYVAALNNLDIPDFYDKEMRTRINKVQGSFEWQIASLLCYNILNSLYSLLRLFVTAIVVAQIAWWILPLLIGFLLPGMIIERKIAKLKWGIWNTKSDDKHIFYGLTQLIRSPKNQMELRTTQARGYVAKRIDVINQHFYKKQEVDSWKAGKYMPAAAIAEVVGTTISLVVLLKQFLSGLVSFDKYLFVSGAVMRVSGALNQLFSTYNGMQDGLLVAKDFFQIIDHVPVIIDSPTARVLESTGVPSIKFDAVCFTYPGQTKPVFKNLSFTIGAGEHIAIVGENGAGKSTLIKLLMRFYRPSSGTIYINGIDLQSIAIESWYKHLATLFQDFNQYPFSVQENIEIGNPSTSGDTEKLHQASDFSNITKQITGYEHGWNTVLDSSFKKGIEPSGGQWQRVALARAFYRQANVLILDEPTAAIDSKAEYDIFNNIFDHYRNKTAIIVSHRFSTVRRASTILVVDAGKIVEQGSHKDLILQKGLYYELFSKQAEGYKD